jgi:hypothetical protein
VGDEWEELVHHKTIGYKNIKRFDQVTSDKVRLNIYRSWDKPMICNFGLYLSAIPCEINNINNDVYEKLDPYYVNSAKLLPGISYTYYAGGIQSAALINSIFQGKLLQTGILQTINIDSAETSIDYSFSYEGYVRVMLDGIYTFRLESANGSVLILNDKVIIDNDEPHDIKAVEKKIKLKVGYYKVKVLYTSFRQNGMLKVSWSGPGFDMKEIDENHLFHKF